MTMRRLALGAVGTAALIGVLHGQQPARTTKDGVFTEEQAGRGRVLYKDRCETCHGAELMGIEAAAPLAGFMFQADWNAATLGELFERIRISMPKDKPGTLSRQEAADAVAFILSANKFPAGQAELPRETEALMAIKIEAPLGR